MATDDSFARFYAAVYPRLVGQLLAVTGDLHDAEDVAQEAFARASTRWAHLRAADR
jgi:RNA polymerase sigma-70 factor, ECF subfamily